jgi:hypothetical protein
MNVPIITHADWCRHLASRGILDRAHRRCQYLSFCANPSEPEKIIRQMARGDQRGRRRLAPPPTPYYPARKRSELLDLVNLLRDGLDSEPA